MRGYHTIKIDDFECILNADLEDKIIKLEYFFISQDIEGCLPWCLAVLKAMQI